MTRSAENSPAVWEALMRRAPQEAVPEAAGRWWVAHTRPRVEKALVLDLRALGVFSYLPLAPRTTRSRASGRASSSIVPVFTGYVFVLPADEDQRRAALTTNRIANLLPVVDQRELVGELRQIQQVLATRTDFEWGPTIEVGDWARVGSGALAGVEGVVIRKVNRTRLALNVKMLAQSVVVEIPRDQLEPIARPSWL